MIVKYLLTVCLTGLLMAAGVLYTADRFGQATYIIELQKVEVKKMEVVRDTIRLMPPAIPQPTPKGKPSVDVPGGQMFQLGYVVAPIHATPTPTPAPRRTTSDGKAVLDGKTLLDSKEILEEAPEIEIELPEHPPFDFIPHIEPTSP